MQSLQILTKVRILAGALVHHISETIKNTTLFHPPGLQMQFYLVPRGGAAYAADPPGSTPEINKNLRKINVSAHRRLCCETSVFRRFLMISGVQPGGSVVRAAPLYGPGKTASGALEDEKV